jgi:ADP-ribose pyrophosphatase YjhB (NUDIX family)
MSGNKVSYGGVVFDDEGRVLLREPRRHYDGDVWTLPKGELEEGEGPKEAALRETLEETGVEGEIVDRIPGSFRGSSGDNIYFVMRPTGRYRPPGNETWSVRWAFPDEARELIAQTRKEIVRRRDLAVLDAALALRRDG